MPLHFCVLHTVLFVPCYVQRYVRHIFDMYENKNEKNIDNAEKNEIKNEKGNRKNADGNEKKMKDEKIKSVETSDENLNDANGNFLVKFVRTFHLDEDIGCIERERNHDGNEVIVGTSVSIILHILSYLFVMFVLQYNCLDHPFLLSDNRSGFVSLF